MGLPRTPVSLQFREACRRTFPGLDRSASYWRLLSYLLFSAWREEDGDRVVISAEILAAIEGKKTQHTSKNYRSGDLLKNFARDVGDWEYFDLNESDYAKRRCRSVRVTLPDELRNMLREELASPTSPDNVYFCDGGSRTASRHKAEKEEVLASLNGAEVMEDTRVISEYLNGLPHNRFSSVVPRLTAARAAVEEQYERSVVRAMSGDFEAQITAERTAETKRLHHLRVLRAIEYQPQPFYSPSPRGRTVRVFARHESLAALSGSIRRVLCPDWLEFDLQQSQLAICAALWQIPLVKAFLNEHASVWHPFFEHLGLDYGLRKTDPDTYSELKKPVKNFLYSLIFGMPFPTAKAGLTTALAGETQVAGIRLAAHPVIVALYEARESAAAAVVEAGGLEDCYGRRLVLDKSEKRHEYSLLAQNAQAYEMALLRPVVDLARSSGGKFDVTLWQHDGFSVAVKDKSRTDYWERRIIKTVDSRAKELGIDTRLVRVDGR